MKKILLTILLLICAVSLTAGLSLAGAYATEDEYVTVVKTLIGENGGSAQAGGSEWAPVGNYSAYNQAVEQIVDETQADGGDMIFRTATNADNTELTAGAWGYSKHSETREKACYDINGLVIKYYDNTSTQKFIVFNENYGQLNSGRFFAIRFNMSNAAQGTNNGNVQLGVWWQGDSNGSYTWDSNLNWLSWSNYNYGNDYDYFSDPAAEHYVEGSTFKGTQNTLEFKLDENNDLCLYLNGQNLANLTALGVFSNVISQCNEGMYVSFYGEGSTGTNALKVTDIYNRVKEWSQGVPATYGTTDASKIETKTSSTGAVLFRNAGETFDYDVTYNVKQYLGDVTAEFSFAGTELVKDDSFAMTLGDVAELTFAKIDDVTANMSVTVGGNKISEQTVPFYFTDVVNVVSLKQLKDYTIVVNKTKYEGSLTGLAEATDGMEDGAANIGYKVNASAKSQLTILSFVTNKVEILDEAEGVTVSGENTVIKPDGKYYAVYNAVDGEYAVETTKQALLDCINVNYKHGAANETATTFRILAGKLVYEFVRGEKTDFAIYVVGDTERKIYETQINYDWTYGDKSFKFVNDKGYGYIVMDGTSELAYIDKTDDGEAYDAIKAAIASVDRNMGTLKFVMADGQSLFAFKGIEYYVETSSKAGWSAGGYGTPKFGYDDENSATLVFNGNSIKKDNDVVVDGFSMKVKTFYDESGSYNSPAVVIASTGGWFTLDTLGTIMFSVEKGTGETAATFRVRGSLGANRYLYLQDFYLNDWNWNNNVENTVKLDLENDAWVWTINGVKYTSDEGASGYNDTFNAAYESFSTNAGVLQFDSGNGYIWKITEINEVVYNTVPTFVKNTLKESYATGEEITATLTDMFKDVNNDVLTFRVVSGDATIEGNVIKFKKDVAGEYDVVVEADDGKGGVTRQTLTFKIVKESKKSCGASVLSVLALNMTITAACACLLLRKKNK